MAAETWKLSQTSVPVPDLLIALDLLSWIDSQKMWQVLLFDHLQFIHDTIRVQPMLKEDTKVFIFWGLHWAQFSSKRFDDGP